MNPEMIELAKRAVACKGWRWMPGMLGWRPDNHGVPHSIRFVEGVEHMEALAGVGAGPLLASGYATCDGYWRSEDIMPDFQDPATLGCLLALAREAWGMPTGITVSYSSDDGLWGVSWSGATHGGWCGRGKTEAEALVVALESN